jgi:hypothetical protein
MFNVQSLLFSDKKKTPFETVVAIISVLTDESRAVAQLSPLFKKGNVSVPTLSYL